MKPRSAAIWLLMLVTLGQPALAYAQGNGGGRSNSQNQDSTKGKGNNQGKGNSNADDNGAAGNKGNGAAGNSNSGKSQGKPVVHAVPALPDTAPQRPAAGAAPAADTQTDALSENQALQAVEAGRAVPLEKILPDLRERTGGEIIDARLQKVGTFLIYVTTVLTPDGKVLTERYYARTGLHVEN